LARARAVFAAFVLLVFCLQGRASDAPQWVLVRTAHFSVTTDAGPERGREVALRFEQMRDIVGEVVFSRRVNFPVPLEIIAFLSSEEFRQFTPLWHGKPTQAAGLFQPSEDRDFILLDLSSPDPYQAVFHEYTHFLLNGNYPPAQLWFDEGLAEYCSTFTMSRGIAEIGVPRQGIAETLHNVPWMPLAELFAVSHQSPQYNETGDRRSLFYAQSWLVVHYIFDKDLKAQLGSYFGLVRNQQIPIADAVQQAFGMSALQLGKQIQGYFQNETLRYTEVSVPEPRDALVYTSEELHTVDAQARLADAHLHSPDYLDKSIGEFQQILQSDPENAAAHRGLGLGYLYKSDFTQADSHFRKAAQFDARDPRALYYLALLQSRESAAGRKPNLGEMRQDLEQSVRLDPDFAGAYHLLAFVQIAEGSPSAAVATEVKALKLRPRDESYMASYAQYLAANRQYDEAEAVWRRLAASDQHASIVAAAAGLEELKEARNGSDKKSGVRIGGELVAQQATPAAMPPEPARPAASASVPAPKAAAAPIAAEASDDSEKLAEAPPKIDKRSILFLKARLVSVDCSASPAATLTLVSGKKTWTMHTSDASHLVVVGADKFSCDWQGRNVAVNYRATGGSDGDLVSLEIE